MSLLELFCHVDDFWKQFGPYWQAHSLEHRSNKHVRTPQLSMSEIMTIVIYFHQSHYRNFKAYYTRHVSDQLNSEFPDLVSYNRFVELMPRVQLPLLAYFIHCRGKCRGISFVDSTPIRVCHNLRIPRHKVFSGLAGRGKSSTGWFYGFKLHLIVNDEGQILSFNLTPGNVDDRKPVPVMTKGLFGKIFADKGYISQRLFDELFAQGLQLVTSVRKNMQNRLMPIADKLMLRKRSIIETINDQLKNISQIEHSRHRSFDNFLVNLLSGLIAYCHQPKKPSLYLNQTPFNSLAIPN
jgi:hypothetical protein